MIYWKLILNFELEQEHQKPRAKSIFDGETFAVSVVLKLLLWNWMRLIFSYFILWISLWFNFNCTLVVRFTHFKFHKTISDQRAHSRFFFFFIFQSVSVSFKFKADEHWTLLELNYRFSNKTKQKHLCFCELFMENWITDMKQTPALRFIDFILLLYFSLFSDFLLNRDPRPNEVISFSFCSNARD